MKRSLYGERDYAFGQRMLTLRVAIGLTQTGLAEKLHISRHAVGGWEAGSSYPKPEHLKAFIALGLQQRIFPEGREVEEIRAFWHAAHQKVLLDEQWLQDLLAKQVLPPLSVLAVSTRGAEGVSTPPRAEPRVDWSNALDVPTFYGREEELALLSQWVLEERCRVVSVLGMGGIGKSALVVTLMHHVAKHFEVVIWRSLRDAPTCEALLDECLLVLAGQAPRNIPTSLEGRLQLLMGYLRDARVLLVLDNLEVLLEEGTGTGHIRADADGYTRLLQRLGETTHQSCLLLTSREKPAELVPLEGSSSPVRSLHLAGLDKDAGAQLLTEKDLTLPSRERLVEVYKGNPLALKIVAQTIVELFGGAISPFLEQGNIVFGGVRKLLDEQFTRLSVLEQSLFYWLAILREPVTLEELQAVLSVLTSPIDVLEALNGLYRRSLIERGQRTGNFTLHSVVLEYATTRLIVEASHEIEQGHLDCLNKYGLCQAQAREYVRKTQEQLLVLPLLNQLQTTYHEQANLEERLLWLLDHVRSWPQKSQRYGPANLVTLLRMLRGDLRGLDLSRLILRGVPLQGTDMQDTTLSDTLMQNSTFTEHFDDILTVTISNNEIYWAAASRRGDIWIWEENGLTLRHAWHAHLDSIWNLAFSPNGRTLASACTDGSVKLWDVVSGTLLWVSHFTQSITWLAFSPNGNLLALGGLDGIVRLWDPQSGTPLKELLHSSTIFSLAWSPDGKHLVSGCSDGSIWIWELPETEPATHVHIPTAHTHWVVGLAFAPDGKQFASASFDGTIKQWNTANKTCLQTFLGHTDRVMRVAWSPDGYTLASCGVDHTIRLWNSKEGRSRMVLQGHTGIVNNLAFMPDSHTLLSGSSDGTIRVWDVESTQCLRVMRGFVASLLDIDWNPDGTQLVSGGADALVILWDRTNATPLRTLHGHHNAVQGVAWSPNGRRLASSGEDHDIRLWDPTSNVCLQILPDAETIDTIFQGLAWSPTGTLLACGSYLRGVYVWNVTTQSSRWLEPTQQTAIYRVAWSPDGLRLAGGGGNNYIYLWDTINGIPQQLAGHHGPVMNVVWSPDGLRLASVGSSREGGELFVWDTHSGKHMQVMKHPAVTFAVAWSPDEKMLISGSSDGILRWWDIQSGECILTQKAHQDAVKAVKISPNGTELASCGDDGVIVLWNLLSGEQIQTLRRDRPYERLNITGTKGLSAAQKASLHALGAFEETSNDE